MIETLGLRQVPVEVMPRELICRPLPALRDNRAEAEKVQLQMQLAAMERHYRRGNYAVMDWLADRLEIANVVPRRRAV
jgi:hypothetical protein